MCVLKLNVFRDKVEFLATPKRSNSGKFLTWWFSNTRTKQKKSCSKKYINSSICPKQCCKSILVSKSMSKFDFINKCRIILLLKNSLKVKFTLPLPLEIVTLAISKSRSDLVSTSEALRGTTDQRQFFPEVLLLERPLPPSV